MDERDRQRYYAETGILVGSRTNDRSVQQQRRRDAINPQHLQLKSLTKKMPDYVQEVAGMTTDDGEPMYRNYKITDAGDGTEMTAVVWVPSRYAEYREGIGLPGVNGPEVVLLQTPTSVAGVELQRDFGRREPFADAIAGEDSFSAIVEVFNTNEKFTIGEIILRRY